MKKVPLMIALLLVTTFLSPITPASQAAGVTRFSDISSKHWAHREIERLQESKLIGGYSDQTFRPNNPITRAEAVKIIVEANHIDIKQPASSLHLQSDVPESYWASPYIEAAQAHHLITGYADGTFRPEATLTRADSAVLIARSFDLNAASSSQSLPLDIGINHWAAASINKLIANGVAIGDQNGKFQPSKKVTRSEFAALLARTLYKEYRVKPATEQAQVTLQPASPSVGSPDGTELLLSSPLPSPSPTPFFGAGGGSNSSGDFDTAVGEFPQPAPLPSLYPSPLTTPSPNPAPRQQEVSALHPTSGETSLRLTWTNPLDSAFKEVNVYKDDSKIATTSGTLYEESGLSPSTTYFYTLKTVDQSNHESSGTVLSITTSMAKPPSPPTKLVATPEDGAIQLQWAKNNESNVSGYNVYVEGLKYNLTTVTEATYTFKGLKNGQNYNLYVTALDTLFVESEPSTSLSVVPMPTDLLAPAEIQQFDSTNSGIALSMAWRNPTDADFERVDIYVGNQRVGTSKDGTYEVQGLQSETDYEFILKSIDNTGNVSNGVIVSIRTNDITPPSIPVQVQAVGGPGIIALSWSANLENDLSGYNLYVNGNKFNTQPITQETYELTTLGFGEMYNIQLEAVDTHNNVSSRSPVVKATLTHYLIERSRWGIYNDGTHPVETTQGINNALVWANTNHINAVWLSSGNYLIDKNSRINMVGNMLFELPGDAVLQKETNGRERYDVLYIGHGKNNVTLRG